MKQFINVKREFTVLIILLLISCRVPKSIIDHYLTKIYQMLIMIVRFGPLKWHTYCHSRSIYLDKGAV